MSSANDLTGNDSFYYYCLYNATDPAFGNYYLAPYDGVTYGGISYKGVPIHLADLNYAANQDASPTVTVGDSDGYLGRLIATYGGIEGCQLSIGRVRRSWLDDGTNPNYSTRTTPEIYVITKLLSRTPYQLSYQIKNRVVGAAAQIPGRTLQSSCTWKVYRGLGCGYTGAYFDINNNRTPNQDEDMCARTDAACKVRANYANFSGVITIQYL